jgi:hypothetical protein
VVVLDGAFDQHQRTLTGRVRHILRPDEKLVAGDPSRWYHHHHW